MRNTDAVFARLESRFRKLARKLSEMWEDDPTVLVSFTADFEALIDKVGNGDIHFHHSSVALNAIYDAHLPTSAGVSHTNLADPNARPVPGHGQFYREIAPALWRAIDYTESNAYSAALPNRKVWLTYTSGARQAA